MKPFAAIILALCCPAVFAPSLFARGGGGCLEQGTLVLTPSGATPVDQLKAGDTVLTICRGLTLTGEVKSVTQVRPDEYREVVVGGRLLRITETHPVETEHGVFRMAGRLQPGDMVLTREEGAIHRAPIESVGRTPALKPAFDLLVASAGTYIAGEIVVHNKGCFLPETLIQKEDHTEVPISTIRAGDRLLSFTPDGNVVCATVRQVVTHEVDDYCVVTTDSRILHVTSEHPFYVGNGTFKTLEALKTGDNIFVFDGHGLSPQKIRSVVTVGAKTRVYNLQTDAPNTFFANGVAVHNKGGGCLAQGTPVMTPDGPVAVERIRAGDAVLAVNRGVTVRATVQAVTRVQPEEYCELTVCGRTLRVTDQHPVATQSGVFRFAALLDSGTHVRILNDGRVTTAPLQSVRRVTAGTPAYNLLVSPGGTYVADGIVVHNKGCFLPDTPIRKSDGTEVPISTIQAGDRLLAFTYDGTIVTAAVQQVLVHVADDFVVVRTAGMTLRVTSEHPFYVGDGTFRTLEALGVGDVVFAFDGHRLAPQRIESIETVTARTHVYNLQTDAPNTFFANGVAVHNKGGGGGGFHGGSHHSYGGSHSSSGGSGEPPPPAVVFTVIGVIVGVVILVKVCKKKEVNLDFVYSPAQVARKADKTRKLLEFLARQDGDMAPDALKKQTASVFLKLQHCWQARDYGPMKPLMMPDLYADHSRQIQGMIRNHEINMIEGVRVDRVDLVNVRYTVKENQREFTALITATAKDYYLDDRTRDRLRGDDAPAQFQEFWTFHRQNKTWMLRDIEQTRESDVLKEDNFFEQFTDVGVDQVYGDTAGKEGPAGSWLEKNVGAKDSRIERLLNFLVETDRIWERQNMLDTSRRVFLELMTSWESGDPDSVSKENSFPELAADLRKQIADNKAQGISTEFRNLCVRKVELILVRNFADNSRDEFVVRVRAHAQRIMLRHESVEFKDDDVTPFEQLMTMGRLDNRWKLKEILPTEDVSRLVPEENLDQDSNPQQLQWYYQHKRAV